MAEFVTLSCPSCGAKLQIGNDIETFACNHCGNEHVVRRTGGIVSLAPVVEQLKKVSQGVDKTASELAIKRLRQEISDLEGRKSKTTNTGCIKIMLSGGCIVAVVIAVFLAAVVFKMWDDSGTGFVVIFTIVTFVIAGIIDIYSEKGAARERNEIDEQISKKYDELQKHKEIVSG